MTQGKYYYYYYYDYYYYYYYYSYYYSSSVFGNRDSERDKIPCAF
jgi:hypothetical protein